MGNLGSVKIIKRPPPAAVQFKAIQDQIARELRPVGQAHVDAREKIVSDWDTDVEFGYRISVTGKQVTLTIVVENDGAQVSDDFTVGDLWKALDKTGVRPHVILPKKQGGRLAFQTNYQPHIRRPHSNCHCQRYSPVGMRIGGLFRLHGAGGAA